MRLLTAAAAAAAGGAAQKIGKTHFYVQEGKSKCFIEEVVAGQAVTVTYENYDNPGVGCSVVFKDPKGRVVFSRPVDHEQPQGKAAYMAQLAGEHEICAVCESSRWFGTSQLKWSLSVDVGDTELTLIDAAKASDAQSMLEQLNGAFNNLAMITTENDMYAQLEEHFHQEIARINSRIIWIAVLQIVVTFVSALWAMRCIARYFRSQKLF